MAFRILNQAPAYLNSLGQPLAGGTLNFYTNGTLTGKNAFATKALTGPTQVVTLDSAGRANTDIWGDGVYRVILKDSLGVTVWDRSDVEVAGGATSGLPALVASQFLTNDGAVTSWAAIRQVPDPTGNSGKQLGTDGLVLIWETKSSSSVAKHQVVTAATTTTIDLALGTNILLNQAVDITTLAFTNPPSTVDAYIVSITRVKDATGTARAITNLSSVATFPGGVPTLTQTASAIDVIAMKAEPGVAKMRGSYMLALS